MTEPRPPFRLAVIADAHFHDTDLDFGFEGFPVGGKKLVMRALGDVARSPRLYNEAGQALRHALDALAAKEIRDVVLLGDYSDDGQAATLAALEALLDHYRQAHGMRFHAVPGNHDIFGDNGRHRRKRFLAEDGTRMLVTSDPDFEAERGTGRIVSDAMFCAGYPENLPRDCGFFGSPGAGHWETPFGTDPDPETRRYEIRSPDGQITRRLMDASYLVEPAPGIWFAMIDANVFVPDAGGDDGLADSTSAGWKAILRYKPFLVDWLADVARRARETGRQLLVFSHYPVLDPLNGTLAEERAMMELTGMHLRVPPPRVGEALIEAGVTLHFSGHVHVEDTARMRSRGRSLVNIAVPSLIAFPAACKIVTVLAGEVTVENLTLHDMPLDPLLMQAYRLERELTGAETGRMLQAETYGDLLLAHLAHATGRRFLKREWPADLAQTIRTSTLAQLTAAAGLSLSAREVALAATVSGVDLLTDWYALRAGGDLGAATIEPTRLALYRRLAKKSATGAAGDRRLWLLFETLRKHLDALPTGNIRIHPATGAISRL